MIVGMIVGQGMGFCMGDSPQALLQTPTLPTLPPADQKSPTHGMKPTTQSSPNVLDNQTL